MTNDTPLLHMQGISKAFPGVQALQNVELSVYPGEILALLGENGAGKSTLMKILNGVYQADSGSIHWQGRAVRINSPHAAQALGISMIHQELALIPYLDAGKNIFLGREPHGPLPGSINWPLMYREAQQWLNEVGVDVPVRRAVRFLSIAQQQMVEVAKALSMNARLIIMDEPTSSLTDREVEKLFAQMRALRERGVAIIFITHRLAEIFEVADRMTVLRDGQLVASKPVSETDNDDMIQMMVGREVGQIYEPRTTPPSDDIVLDVRNLTRSGVVQDVSFQLRKGEVLGIAGLVGAGRTELAETLFGAHPATSGEIVLEGETVVIRHPTDAIARGIGLVPEDRKGSGLFLGLSVGMNIVMLRLWAMLRALLLLDWARIHSTGDDYIKRLDIRTPSAAQRVGNLSGGNQQKAVIAKWLTLDPKVLIMDEPTRGIDVGAKSEIYRLMNQLAARGVGLIVISSELPEVLGMSDRILVMHEGRVTGEFDARTATQDDLMQAAVGAS